MKQSRWRMSLLLGILLAMYAIPMKSDAAAEAARARNEVRHLNVGADRRTYVVHRPVTTVPPGLPLVIVLHGALGNAFTAEFDTRMSRKSDECGFLAVYPNGSHGIGRTLLTWNAGECCGPASQKRTDDIKFLRFIVEDMKSEYGIDPDRVYVTGLSNGGMLAYLAGCELSDLVAAIAPVDGCMTFDTPLKAAVSVIALNGTRDTVIRSDGGTGSMLGYKVYCPPAEATIKKWAELDGCSQKTIEHVGEVEKDTYTGGAGGTEVCLYKFPGKHIWPGGRSLFPICGFSYKNLDATDVIWSFFERHPKVRPGGTR